MWTVLERFHRLTPHRQDHILRVVRTMEALAVRHQLPLDGARWAGFGHDLARELSRPALLEEAERLGLSVDPSSRAEPILLHGPIAARWMAQDGIGDRAVWQAIWFHTTAGAGLDSLGRALFIADAIEPGRRYATREALWRLAMDDLVQGYRAVLEETMEYNQRRNIALHSDTARAWQELNEAEPSRTQPDASGGDDVRRMGYDGRS